MMFSSRDFFTISEVFGDREFWKNFGLAIFGVIVLAVAFALTIGKLKVNTIGPVTVIDKPAKTEGKAFKPISEIATASGNKTSTAPEYVGWVVNLEDLCKTNEYPVPMESSVILIQTPEGNVTAATTKISPKACEVIKKIVDKKGAANIANIYAAGDHPFSGVREQKYIGVVASSMGASVIFPK